MRMLSILSVLVFILGVSSSGSPVITNTLKNLTVPEGKDASFTCSVKNLGGYRVSKHTQKRNSSI